MPAGAPARDARAGMGRDGRPAGRWRADRPLRRTAGANRKHNLRPVHRGTEDDHRYRPLPSGESAPDPPDRKDVRAVQARRAVHQWTAPAARHGARGYANTGSLPLSQLCPVARGAPSRGRESAARRGPGDRLLRVRGAALAQVRGTRPRQGDLQRRGRAARDSSPRCAGKGIGDRLHRKDRPGKGPAGIHQGRRAHPPGRS